MNPQYPLPSFGSHANDISPWVSASIDPETRSLPGDSSMYESFPDCVIKDKNLMQEGGIGCSGRTDYPYNPSDDHMNWQDFEKTQLQVPSNMIFEDNDFDSGDIDHYLNLDDLTHMDGNSHCESIDVRPVSIEAQNEGHIKENRDPHGTLLHPRPIELEWTRGGPQSKRASLWYREHEWKDKRTVIDKMSILWYGDLQDTNRHLARSLIVRYFTPQDFEYVLHCKGGLEDEILLEIVQRARGVRGKANNNFTRSDAYHQSAECANKFLTVKEEDRHDMRRGNDKNPPWYQEITSLQDKMYVISRMAYVWFGNSQDRLMRIKARKRIVRTFTAEDFNIALSPDTDYATLVALAERTKKSANQLQKEAISAMRERLRSKGVPSRTLNRYVRSTLEEASGLDSIPIEELESKIEAKCAMYHGTAYWERKKAIQDMKSRLKIKGVPQRTLDNYVKNAVERHGLDSKNIERLEAEVAAECDSYLMKVSRRKHSS